MPARLCLVSLFPLLLSAQLRLDPLTPDPDAQGYLMLGISAPSNSLVAVEGSVDLRTPNWTNVLAGVPAPEGVAHFVPPLPSGATNALQVYRAVATPHPLAVTDDGERICLSLSNAVPQYLVWLEIEAATGRGVYPVDPEQDPFALLGPGSVCATNVEALVDLLGVPAWVGPGDLSDSNYLARISLPSTALLERLELDPALVGSNLMEDGWAGDSALPVPRPGDPDPGTDPLADNVLTPGALPAPPGVFPAEDPLLTQTGQHVRLRVRLSPPGTLEVLEVLHRPGNAILPPVETGVPEGSLLLVSSATDPSGGPPELFSVRALLNPFFDHPYGHEFGNDNTPHLATTGSVEFWIPMPMRENDTDLSALSLTVYRVLEDLDPGPLDADAVARQMHKMSSLTEIDGPGLGPLPPKGNQDLMFPPGAIWPGSSRAPEVTPIYISGSRAKKFNLVIIGDGFNNSTNSQAVFNTWVEEVVEDTLRTRDVHPEILNAMNVYRINAFSVDEGVTQVNSNGVVTLARQTSLGYRYSGIWERLWMEPSDDTYERISKILASSVPEADLIISVINQTTGGGRANSPYVALGLGNPTNSNWGTVAHELGHAFGKLGDEYQCNIGDTDPPCPPYMGEEPGTLNHTKAFAWNQLKWRDWTPPWRPLPTLSASFIADSIEDIGLFPGVTRGTNKYWGNIYRPARQTRMRGGSERHHPIGYRAMRLGARPYQTFDFRRQVVGHFRSSVDDMLWLLDGRQFREFIPNFRFLGPDDPVLKKKVRAEGRILNPYLVNIIQSRPPQSPDEVRWLHDSTDRLLPGDFSGDGVTDLYLHNPQRWSDPVLGLYRAVSGNGFSTRALYIDQLPGYGTMAPNDRGYPGDFNGDGADDLFWYNGVDWNQPHLGLLRVSNDGSDSELLFVRRYDTYLPGIEMGRHEDLYVGDFTGDGKDDILFHNRQDWAQVNLMAFRSTGGSLVMTDRHYGSVTNNATPGIDWVLRRKDVLLPGDFNADGRMDFALFNGFDWGVPLLGIFTSDADGRFTLRRRFAGQIGPVPLSPHDRFTVSDANGDGRDDLILLNTEDWNHGMLVLFRMQADFSLVPAVHPVGLGSWTFAPGDMLSPMEFTDDGWKDLLIFSQYRLGLLRSEGVRFVLEAHYPDYIQNHRYHRLGYW